MKDIRFSILVPVYNVENYITKCVESVINQTYSNFELILVDDGSSDSSGKICDEYAEIDKRVTVYHKKNQGLIHTRRFAIDKARGDYYVFLDSDDYLALDALEVIISTIEKYDCDCVIYNFQRVIDNKTVSTPSWELIKEEEYITDKKELYKRVLFNQVYNSLCRKAVKATVFDGRKYDRYFGLSHGEDLLQTLEIIKNCRSSVFIPNMLYNYTINPNSITENISFENFRIDFTIAEEVLKFVKEENVFDSHTLDEFYSSRLRDVLHKIMKISRFKTSNKNKKELYLKIRNENYYKEITSRSNKISKLGKMKVVYALFSARCYGLLSLFGRLF